MHRYSRTLILIGIALSVIVLSGIVLATPQKPIQPTQAQNWPPLLPTILRSPSATRPAYCVPLPPTAQPIGTPTPTPSRLSSALPITSPMPDLVQAVNPRAHANIFDLSPELPLRDKSEIIVFRCNGTFDQYWAGPEVDVDSFLNLEPGDVVYSSAAPASMMGHRPPPPPDWSEITPQFRYFTLLLLPRHW